MDRSCVLSVAVVIICIAIDFQARVVMDKADVDYDRSSFLFVSTLAHDNAALYSLGLGSAVLALIVRSLRQQSTECSLPDSLRSSKFSRAFSQLENRPNT